MEFHYETIEPQEQKAPKDLLLLKTPRERKKKKNHSSHSKDQESELQNCAGKLLLI